MSETRDNSPARLDANDLLLYLGAAVIAAVGLTWLILAKPWADAGTVVASVPEALVKIDAAPATLTQRPTQADRPAEEALRLAGLAQAAGMLFEPPRYSAWALYSEVLASDPTNAAARDGIARVADAVVARAATALEQGRMPAAKESIDAVLARLPEHTGAQELVQRIEEGTARREAEDRAEAEADSRELTAASAKPAQASPRRRVTAASPARVDPLQELRGRFDTALSAEQLLLPDTESAKHVLSLMTALDAGASVVVEARDALLAVLLERADEAMAAVDFAAAETWIDEAAALGGNAGPIEQARFALRERLIAVESETPVSASTLVLAAYAPPRYPSTAEKLEIEGWVDLEFVVSTDGSTTDVRAVAGSHDELFREEAIAAAQKWRFEPRSFLDRPIPQKAYTRVRFEFE